MMKPRGTVTNKLSDVLQVLQLSRRTGLLEIERASTESIIEQGTITFQNGQITDARTGSYRGAAAVGMLSRWTTCYFTFHMALSPEKTAPNITSTQQSPNTNELERERTTGPLPVPRAPYRLFAIDEALTYFPARGLTRAHRQLFLLIDGQRTAQELMRLTGRIPNEVEALLTDLERTGFIRQ